MVLIANSIVRLLVILSILLLSCKREGCTSLAARNYDEKAKRDDGSCEFPGCTDENAINYSSLANVDDGSCHYTGSATFYLDDACCDVDVYVSGELIGELNTYYTGQIDCENPPIGTASIEIPAGLYNFSAVSVTDTVDTTWSGQVTIFEKQCTLIKIDYN